MVGVALPSIRADLDLSTSQLQWIVSGYVLGYGGLLLLGGRAADLLGRRRVLLVALAVFAVASLARRPRRRRHAARSRRASSRAPPPRSPPPPGSPIITTTFARARAQQGARHLHRVRRQRLLPRPRPRRPADRGRLAAGPSCCRSRSRCDPARRSARASSPRTARPRAPRRRLRPGRRRAAHRRDAAARRHVRWRGGRLGRSARFALARLLPRFVAIEQRTPHPLVRLGILRSGSLVRANLGAMAHVRLVRRLPVHRHALPAGDAAAGRRCETALAFLPAGLIVAFGSPRIGAADRAASARPADPGLGRSPSPPATRCSCARRRDPVLRSRCPADDAAARRRLRARLPRAEHPGDGGRRRPRAGPGRRARADVVPGRRRDRAGRRSARW